MGHPGVPQRGLPGRPERTLPLDKCTGSMLPRVHDVWLGKRVAVVAQVEQGDHEGDGGEGGQALT